MDVYCKNDGIFANPDCMLTNSNSYGVTGVQRVTGVTHRYGHPHLMSLTVEAWPDSRAAGSGDTITV